MSIHSLAHHYYIKHKNLVLYGIIGVSGATLDFALFLVLFNIFDLNPLLANFISTNAGIINNFFLNAHYNFKRTDRLGVRFISFYLTGVLGIIVSSLIIRIFHGELSFDANLVKAASIVIVVIMQYILNKTLSFRNYK